MLSQLVFISMTIASLGSVPAPVSDARHQSVVRAPKRADIQGLRAVAVTLVVVYHFFPTAIPGGFVGVDVFFVISGFLITLLLIREIDRTGTISLPKFYVRRVRRLMPAALTTTIATVAAAALTVGPVRLVSILKDAAWTSGYLANVHFGLDPSGYFALSDPSPFLHYWSLAVEEQYYVVWPALLVCIVLLAKKRVMLLLPIVLTMVVMVSLAVSIVLTNSGSSHAYYSLASRAWELAIGGVVAYVVFREAWVPGKGISAAVGQLGAGAVLFSAFSFSENTSFPGSAALIPTAGTALVIWSGTYHGGLLGRVLSFRPAQFVGDISYSLYLWHWPVLVLGVGMLNSNSRSIRAVLLGVSLVTATASFYLVERRVGGIGKGWRSRNVLALNLAIVLVAVAVPTAAARIPISGGPRVAPSAAGSAIASFKDGTVTVTLNRPIAVPRSVPSNANPSLVDLTQDLSSVFTNGCFGRTLKVCEGGDARGTVTVVLAGDSHAGQWWPAANQAAIENHWKLYLVGMNGCPLANVEISRGATSSSWPDCRAWQREAPKAIVALNADLVMYANFAQGYALTKVSLRHDFEAKWSRGVSEVLKEIGTTSKVLVFGESPWQSTDPATCLSRNLQDVSACSTPVNIAERPDIRAIGPRLAREAGAEFFDPTSLLCTDVCPVMDQNVVMYRDRSHVSRTYSLLLSAKLAAVISAALPQP